MVIGTQPQSAIAKGDEISPTAGSRNGKPARHATRRDCAKLIRFSIEELDVVTARAAAAGRPVACFIRESAMGQKPRVRTGVLGDAVVHQLGRVAVRLEEVSAGARAAGIADVAQFDEAVRELLDTIRSID